VGDTLLLRMQEDETASAYVWGDKLTRHESYTVIGIVSYHEDYFLNVYVPYAPDSPTPVRFASMLGQATVRNGTAGSFLNDIKPMLSERVFVNVYDQGYQAAANAFAVIRNAAAVLTIIACVLAVVALALFAYLYTRQQQEAVEIMRSFGTSKPQTRLYLLFGAGCIALVAIVAGFLTGVSFSEKLVTAAYRFVSELQAVDMRYSDGNIGLIKEFAPMAADPVPLSVAISALVFVLALSVCLYFAEKTISGSFIALKLPIGTRRPPKRSSTAFSGVIRHALLSIRRGGVRTFIIPVLSAAALLFTASLQATRASYVAAREELYETTELSGYCSTMSGKYSGGLFIPNKHAIKLVKADYFENVSFTYRMNYGYLGIVEHADGTKGEPDPVPNPNDVYSFENQKNKLSTEPLLVFTSSAENAPEFRYRGFHGSFMEGWDEVRFSSREWDRLPCIVSTHFMAQHGIQPGDTIRVYVYFHQNYIMFTNIDMLVVGSFLRASGRDNIYCPLPLGALDPDRSALNELGGDYAPPLETDSYYDRIGSPDMIDRLTQQQFLDYLLDLRYVSSLSFTTSQVRKLCELKDQLEGMGFSGPKMGRDINVFVLLEDSRFNETISSITQRSKYLEILYPVLLMLVCILALITGYLTVNSRREDIGLMRGLGVSKKRVFGTIFGEQILLLLFGTLPAAVLWLVREGIAQLATPGVYAFLLCYASGAAISVSLQNARSPLSILTDNPI